MPVCAAPSKATPSTRPLLRSFLSLAKADQVPLETPTLSYIADQRMKRAMIELLMSSGSLEMLERALTLARIFSGAALRAESLAGAEHLVRDPAHLQLRAHLVDPRRPPLWEKRLQRPGLCLSIDTEAIRADEKSPPPPATN